MGSGTIIFCLPLSLIHLGMDKRAAPLDNQRNTGKAWVGELGGYGFIGWVMTG
jgi:hypothetical protein